MKKMEMMSDYEKAHFAADCRGETREASGLTVTVISLPSMDVTLRGTLSDLSKSGVGLLMGRPLRPGASFAVEWDDTIILAQVVYCLKEARNYRAGLRISYIILDRSGSEMDRSRMLQ